MKKLLLFGTLALLLLFAAACNSDEDTNEDQTDTNNQTEENGGETTDDTNAEENNTEETSDDEETEPSNDAGDEETTTDDEATGDVLRLGETGKVESTIGDYDVTVESFQLLDEMEGDASLMELFVLVDVSITNTGSTVLLGEDINNAALFNDAEITQENTLFYESIDLLQGEIAPGDTLEGQMLFHQSDSEYYELIFNYGLEGVSTELTWRFEKDEASE